MEKVKWLANEFGDRYIYSINKNVFESESSAAIYDREFKNGLFEESSLQIFIGSDSAALIKYLLNNSLPLGTRYFFIEPDDYVESIKAECPALDDESGLWVVNLESFKELVENQRIEEYLYLDKCYLKRSLAAQYGYDERYRTIFWEVEAYLKDTWWNVSTRLGQEIFLKCQLRNCSDNNNSISKIKGCLKGGCALVLGGGPSLDDHLEWIKLNRDKFYIFAVSRISKRLIEVGLEPDFVISVDPQDVSYYVSREMLGFSNQVVFINQYHAAPQLVSQWPHRKYFTGNVLPWESNLNPRESELFEGVGPTVTNQAVATAWWLGAKKILLAGVDLCFTSEGYTHANGTRERENGVSIDTESFFVETNAGERVATRPDFISAAESLRVLAEALINEGVKIINLSAQATAIAGIDFSERTDLNIDEVGHVSLEWDPVGLDRLKDVQDELASKISEIDKLMALVESAIELHDSMYLEDGLVDPLLKIKLEGLEENFKQNHGEIFELAKCVCISDMLKMSNKVRDLDTLESNEIRERLEVYYCGLRSGLARLRMYISDGLATANRRISEKYISGASFEFREEILAGWINNQEAGRYRILDQYDCDSVFLNRAKDIFDKDQNFDYFGENYRNQKKLYRHTLPHKVIKLLDLKDINSLQVLEQSLIADVDYKPYIPLIRSSIATLRGNLLEAINELIPVMDDLESPILEPTLGRIFDLTSRLGMEQASMDALAGLACIDKKYLGLYADALAANNQLVDALEHKFEYLRYFQPSEKDVSKIASWCTVLGVEVSDFESPPVQ